jgi:hypothetical protein
MWSKPRSVHLEHAQGLVGDLAGDAPAGLDLGEVAHPAQQPVGDARRAAGAAGDLGGAVRLGLDGEDLRRAADDVGQVLGRVVLQPLHDAEAIAQRRGQQPGARGRADQRERRQVELDGARRRARRRS